MCHSTSHACHPTITPAPHHLLTQPATQLDPYLLLPLPLLPLECLPVVVVVAALLCQWSGRWLLRGWGVWLLGLHLAHASMVRVGAAIAVLVTLIGGMGTSRVMMFIAAINA